MNVDEFYRKNYKHLCNRLRRYVRGTSLEVEDVVQEAFVRVVQKFDQFDPMKGKDKVWVDRVIFSTLWNMKRKTIPIMVDIEDFINSIEVSTATDKKVKDRILNVVDDTHKAVLFAVYLLNYSRADVSAVLKLSDFEVREIISKYQMEWE